LDNDLELDAEALSALETVVSSTPVEELPRKFKLKLSHKQNVTTKAAKRNAARAINTLNKHGKTLMRRKPGSVTLREIEQLELACELTMGYIPMIYNTLRTYHGYAYV
jgi:hypothetical protein